MALDSSIYNPLSYIFNHVFSKQWLIHMNRDPNVCECVSRIMFGYVFVLKCVCIFVNDFFLVCSLVCSVFIFCVLFHDVLIMCLFDCF